MTPVLLRWHLGLGDAILCNGLVRTLIHSYDHIVLPCYKRNEQSVLAMFQDLHDEGRIETIIVDGEGYESPCKHEIKLGYNGINFDDTRFDWSFYNQAGVPFTNKWTEFKLPYQPTSYRTKMRDGYIHDRYIHDDSERGFNIPLEGVRTARQDSHVIFDHIAAIDSCAEFHGINSCFAILVDLSPDLECERFLHRYARPDGAALPIFGRVWTICNEPL